MKKIFNFLAVAASIVAYQSASADTITSLVVNDGSGLTTFTTGLTSGGADFSSPQLLIQEFTAGGITFDTFVGTDGLVGGDGSPGDVEAIVFAPTSQGGAAPAGAVINNPGPDLGVFGDLDLSTGSLDTSQVFPGSPANEFFSFASQTIANDTVFFIFNNGTPLSSVTLVDSAGVAISNGLNFTAVGGESELSDFVFSRTNGGDLTNRDVHGNTFAVSEFTLNGGASLGDIAGFRAAGASSDFHDAGIASVSSAAIPEPSSMFALLGGLGTLLARRRK